MSKKNEKNTEKTDTITDAKNDKTEKRREAHVQAIDRCDATDNIPNVQSTEDHKSNYTALKCDGYEEIAPQYTTLRHTTLTAKSKVSDTNL